MKFIKLEDIKIELKEYLSDEMLDGDYSFLDMMEAASIEKVKSYTSNIVHIDYELSKINNDRNPDLRGRKWVLLLFMAMNKNS
jgi:hypothetical protein